MQATGNSLRTAAESAWPGNKPWKLSESIRSVTCFIEQQGGEVQSLGYDQKNCQSTET